jgi:hypothetical protein
MASKTTRRANAAGKKKVDNAPIPKDDGTRWTVHDTETRAQVYPGSGIMRSEAERLATTLLRPAYIVQVA